MSPAPLPDRFTTSPASPFPAGTVVTVCFTNPALAGQTITVDVRSDTGESQSLAITLNTEGYGCVTWTAPSWDTATFQHSTSADHAVVIT